MPSVSSQNMQKSWKELDNNEPRFMIVFSWVLILFGKNALVLSLVLIIFSLTGLVMLAGVIMTMGEVILDWSLENFSTTKSSHASETTTLASCDCKCS